MIYLDNAATTYPKPPKVTAAVREAMERFGANPGRSGHAFARATAMAVYRCRETAARFFGAPQPENVAFMLNCTTALNTVIKGVLQNGGRALISDVDHNAVVRPLHAVSPRRPIYDVASVSFTDQHVTLENFRRAIRPDTRLIVCTHASNVWGVVQPIRAIGELARSLHIPFAVDAAQTAGVLPIDMEKDNVDFLCVAGHKGLYGPMGTGMLLTSGRYDLPSLIQGGTGSRSMETVQPSDWPDCMESGTVNTVGICGLRAGMEWVEEIGIERLYAHELQCVQRWYDCLQSTAGVRVYTPFPQARQYVPVLSFTCANVNSEQTAEMLDAQGIATRAGLHCAPLAHQKAGTLQSGTVRLAPSIFTSWQAVEKTCKIIQQTAQKTLQ